MRISFFICFLFLSYAAIAFGQSYPHWQALPSVPWAGRYNVDGSGASIFFVNEQYGFVYVGADSTLFRTTDGCQTWDSIPFSEQAVPTFYLTPAHLFGIGIGDQYSNTQWCGIYESLDSGSHWRHITPDSVQCSAVYATGDTIYAIEWISDSVNRKLKTGNVYKRTTDDGKSWHDFADGFSLLRQGNLVGNRAGTLAIVNSGPNGLDELTTDGGASWTYGPPTNPAMTSVIVWSGNQWMMPGTTNIFDLEDSEINLKTYSVNIWVSNDGLSFHEPFQLQVPEGFIPNEIAGSSQIQLRSSSCSPVYFQLSSGANTGAFYRTTDLGETWKNVNGPGGAAGSRFSVVGRGAVVYALYFLGTHYPYLQVWRTTDGGDGMLTSSVLPETSLQFSSSTDSVLENEDTIFTQLCTSVPLRLSVSFTGCDMIWLDSASIDSLAPNLYYDTLDNRGISGSSQPDTETIVIVPTKAGTFPIRINARLLREDFIYEDTSISVVLVIRSDPGVLTVSPTKGIDFGTQALCNPVAVKDSIRLSAHGCQQVAVDSIVLSVTHGKASDFTFTPIKSFFPDSMATPFAVSFKPSIADSERGNIFIYWSDGENQHIDTISLAGAGVSDTRSFSISCDTVAVRECDSTTGILHFTNTTCGTLVFDSLMLPSGFIFEVPAPTFPFTLFEGKSDSLVVNCSLGSVENSIFSLGDTAVIANATLLFNDHGTMTSFDTTIEIPMHVERGIATLSLSTDSLDFGSVSVCGGSAELPVGIMSVGCDTVSGISDQISGMGGMTIEKKGIALLPTGSRDTTIVTFIPTRAGTIYDTLFIVSNAGTEIVLMRGIGTSGTSIFSVDSSLRNFGSRYECETGDTTVELINKGCDTLTITGASFSNGAVYRLDTTLPLTISPLDSVPVRLTFTPQSGNLDDTVHFISNANTGVPTISIPLTGGIIPPATLELVLGPVTVGKQGAMVNCYAVLEGQLPAAITGISFDLTHNDDLLGYQSASGMNAGTVTKLSNGIIQQPFTIAPLRIAPLSNTDTLGTITFTVNLTDSSATALDLSNISFTTSKTLPLDCIASIAGIGTTFSFQNSCGDSSIRDAMEQHLPFTIQSIVPNPAQTEINITVSKNSEVAYELLDELGRPVLSGKDIPPSLNVRSLSEGTYYLRCSYNGYTETRRITIAR